MVAEVPNPVGHAGQPDAPLQELPRRHTGPVAAALLLGQEVERADEPLRLRRREGGVAGQAEASFSGGHRRRDGDGGEAEENREA